jgi:hypothetical protein
VSPTTSTTTTIPDPGAGTHPLTLTDTGLTRARISLSSQAAWVSVDLVGTTFDLTKVVSQSGSMQITGLGGHQIAASGTGSVVIDAVLSVPKGSATSLAMCKNYLGGASVTVTRLTTSSPTVVGSLVNAGLSSEVPPGGCENYKTAPMARADLIGPVRWPARRDARPLVLAGYYPWYDPATLSGTTFGDQPIGPADTSNAADVAEAVALADRSGIDGFVVEWEATAAHEPKVDLLYAAAAAHGGFSLALQLDFAILQWRPGGLTAAGLDAALNEVAKRASSPTQLEVDGKPVIFIYASWSVTPAEWAAALDRLATRTGVRPFVIADGNGLSSPGEYAYGTNHLSDPAALKAWADDRVRALQEVPGLDGRSGPLWVAPVSPGYDERRLGRPNPIYVDRNNGLRYEQSWDAALASLPDWILVTSWNEYYEQTHVMPGNTTGNRALDQTGPRSATFHTTG